VSRDAYDRDERVPEAYDDEVRARVRVRVWVRLRVRVGG
jgi:hypothetical protein